jgi:hypothetical protein
VSGEQHKHKIRKNCSWSSYRAVMMPHVKAMFEEWQFAHSEAQSAAVQPHGLFDCMRLNSKANSSFLHPCVKSWWWWVDKYWSDTLSCLCAVWLCEPLYNLIIGIEMKYTDQIPSASKGITNRTNWSTFWLWCCCCSNGGRWRHTS